MKRKPEPYKWIVTPVGVVECYQFDQFTRRNPPPPEYETPVIPFPCGYRHGDSWVGI